MSGTHIQQQPLTGQECEQQPVAYKIVRLFFFGIFLRNYYDYSLTFNQVRD